MSVRRPILIVLTTAAIGLAACTGATASALPSLPPVPASVEAADLEGFCEDFAGAISSDWPNIDQTTATELSSIVTEWSANPELASIQADVATIGTWLASQATATTVATPPPDVETAFRNVTAFADANC